MPNEQGGLVAAGLALVALIAFGLWDRIRRPADPERWFRTYEPGTEPAEPTELPGWPGSETPSPGAGDHGSGPAGPAPH
jgi:hypothetical protein